MKLWVVSDASPDDATECAFLHFWTPGGLTRSSGQEQVASAKRAGWKDTISSTDEHLDKWLRHMKLTRDDVREAIGGVLARADYPALYEMIGTAFGAGDGDETFSLPDMRGKVL